MLEVIWLLLKSALWASLPYIIGVFLVLFGIIFGIICIVKSSNNRKLAKKTFIIALSAFVIGIVCVIVTPYIKRQISYSEIEKIGPRVDATLDSDEFEYNGVTYVRDYFSMFDGDPNGEPKFVIYYTNMNLYFQVYEVKTVRGDVCYWVDNFPYCYFPKDSLDEIEDYYKESAPMEIYAAVYDQGNVKSRDEYEKDGVFDFKRIEIDRELFDKINYNYGQNLVELEITDELERYYIYGSTADKIYSTNKIRVAVIGDMVLWDFLDDRENGIIYGYTIDPENEKQIREALKKVYG